MGGSIDYSLVKEQTLKRRNARMDESMGEIKAICQKISVERKTMIGYLLVEDIVRMLNEGSITSLQIVAVLCERTSAAGRNLSLITEDNFAEAIEMAKECDRQRKQVKKNNWVFGDEWDMEKYFPPLFGVPISVKDNIDIKGMVSTFGLCARANNRMSKDSILITCLRNGGVIPFVKTNMPQIGRTIETMNNVFGRSQNPYDRSRTVGGSSGGEGGIIAAGCSILGVGTDIGGSIRIPASFCGIFGIKPASSRFSSQYHTFSCHSFVGMTTIKSACGSLGTSVQSLALWYKTVCCKQFYNNSYDLYHYLPPFNDVKYLTKPKKCRIGYLTDLQFMESSPACKRAVLQCKSILQDLDYELVPIKIPLEQKLIQALYIYFISEGGMQSFTCMLQGQQICDQYKRMYVLANLNPFLYSLINFGMDLLYPRLAFIMRATGHRTTYEYLVNSGKIIQYRKEFAEFWRKNSLDYILMPTNPSCAFKHTKSVYLLAGACYAMIWNVLDTTVGAVPVTLVKDGEEVYESKINDDITYTLQQSNKHSVGMPIGVQIVGLPYQDEKVLSLMKVLESSIQFNRKYPRKYKEE